MSQDVGNAPPEGGTTNELQALDGAEVLTMAEGSDAAPADPPAPPPQPRSSANAHALLAGALAFLAAALLASNELGGMGGDDAEYLLLARSIREHGAYVSAWSPGPPTPHTLYPPGLPLLLAPFAGGAQPAYVAVHLVLAAAGGVAVALLTPLFARRGLPPVAAAAGAFAVALSPTWLRCATDVLSELPFLACVAGSLLALETPDGGRMAPRRMAAAAALAAGAFLMRTAAVALVPWVVLALVLPRRGGGRAGWTSAAALAAVVLGWFAYTAAADAGGVSYSGEIARSVEGEGPGLLARAWDALTGEYLPGLPSLVFPSSGAVWTACGWTLWALAATGIVARAARTRRLAAPEAYVLLSLAMLCAWSHRDPRFGVPLVPFVVLFALEGVGVIAATVASKAVSKTASNGASTAARCAAVAVAIACVVPNAVLYARTTHPRASRATPPVEGVPASVPLPVVGGFYDTWSLDDAGFATGTAPLTSYLLLCQGLRDEPSAPKGAILASNPRVTALLSGRQALAPVLGDAADATLEKMRAAGVELVLVDSFVNPRSGTIRELLRSRGDRLEQVGGAGKAYLFRLRPR